VSAARHPLRLGIGSDVMVKWMEAVWRRSWEAARDPREGSRLREVVGAAAHECVAFGGERHAPHLALEGGVTAPRAQRVGGAEAVPALPHQAAHGVARCAGVMSCVFRGRVAHLAGVSGEY